MRLLGVGWRAVLSHPALVISFREGDGQQAEGECKPPGEGPRQQAKRWWPRREAVLQPLQQEAEALTCPDRRPRPTPVDSDPVQYAPTRTSEKEGP